MFWSKFIEKFAVLPTKFELYWTKSWIDGPVTVVLTREQSPELLKLQRPDIFICCILLMAGEVVIVIIISFVPSTLSILTTVNETKPS